MNATLSHLIGVKLQKEDIASLLISATAIAGGLQAIRWGILPFISNKVGQMLDRSARKNYILVLFMALNSVLLLIISFNIFFIFWLPMLLIHLVISSCTTNIIDTLYSNLSSRGENSVLQITLYTVVVDLGAALGPFLGYWLENLIGLTSLFLICSFVCLLLALKWLFNRYSNKSYSKRAQESL
ncbi:Major Facilitator Superfamily [Mycobacteroides abscessus subsp. abscessus]|nr:Major Facilitator Superfamily [Mycobacteroides abscessus subsp. abscessus]